jgi:CheY-like chemotaxis protein
MFARAPRPDLILLDLRLPKIDGLEVLSEIRSDSGLKSIPVVVMTASEDDDDKQRCEMLDVECYITKPVNLKKFMAVVKKLKSP